MFHILVSLFIGWFVSILGFRDDIVHLTHIDDSYYYGIFALIGIVLWFIAVARGTTNNG